MDPLSNSPAFPMTRRARAVLVGVLVTVVMVAGVTLQIDRAEARTDACNGLSFLIVHADAVPNRLRNELLLEPGVTVVDFFDGVAGTPSLAQLSAYDVVIPLSDAPWQDAATLGNSLADYIDDSGSVVALNFSNHESPAAGIQGRYLVDGYSPFQYGPSAFSDATLGDHDPSNFLMRGVTALNAFFRLDLTVATGATQIATWSDGFPLVAFKGRVVGINFHPQEGADTTWSGDFARVIGNAGKWLSVDCPTTSTLQVQKTINQIRASGKVSPKHPGRRVTVTLLKKTGAGFQKLATKKPRLSPSSKYSARFDRPVGGKCRIKVRFAGHKGHVPVHLGSRASKTFAC